MSRNSIWVLLLAAAIVSVSAGGALAALSGSAHDIYAFKPAVGGKTGACSYCHVPHKATGNKLFPNAIDISGLTSDWLSNDQVSRICWSCHGSTSSVQNSVRNVMPFQDTSHKRLVSNLTGWGDDSNLTGVYGLVDGTSLSCVSCHNVHDNEKRPFLR
ncbi:MAG: cytochrome c3 family protein, partial [Candidatus Deferrimicrobiota bacterium]